VQIEIAIMSGVADGTSFKLSAENGDGHLSENEWTISIGRRDDNDITIGYDTYVSRWHAFIHCRNNQWYFEDPGSTNGSFFENEAFEDVRIDGVIKITSGQFIRIGRTWICVHIHE